jgi:hypothetical protein
VTAADAGEKERRLVSPGLTPEEHILLAHYSGGSGVGAAMALIKRQPGQAPTLSEWEDASG